MSHEPGRALVAALALAALASCTGMGGVRPRFGPVPGSVLLELTPPPDSVIRALATHLAASGFAVRTVAPREGYLESGWTDAASRAAREPRPGRLREVVKLRFFADPVAGRTRLLAECVRRLRVDPSLPERELERMVPEDHPGRAALDSVLARLEGRVER